MDRIVSVGMFEHVGLGFYDRYFRKCADLLAEDGVMVLSSIGRSEGPNVTSPWIAKYIFPGGNISALSEVMPSIERAGLLVTDIEVLRLHCAETLNAWRTRFLTHVEDLRSIYDEPFLRMRCFAASEDHPTPPASNGLPPEGVGVGWRDVRGTDEHYVCSIALRNPSRSLRPT